MSLRHTTPITLALSLLICCGASSGSCNSDGDTLGPSQGEAVGLTVALVAVVAAVIITPVEISHSHHTLKGCILSTPSGLELRTADNKTYALSGTTTNLAPGNTIRLHGNRQKHDKTPAATRSSSSRRCKKTTALARPSPQPLLPRQRPRPAASHPARAMLVFPA